MRKINFLSLAMFYLKHHAEVMCIIFSNEKHSFCETPQQRNI